MSKCVTFPANVSAGNTTFTIQATNWTTSWSGYPAFATIQKDGSSANNFNSSSLTSVESGTSAQGTDFVNLEATSPPFTINNVYTVTFNGLAESQPQGTLQFCLSNEASF